MLPRRFAYVLEFPFAANFVFMLHVVQPLQPFLGSFACLALPRFDQLAFVTGRLSSLASRAFRDR